MEQTLLHPVRRVPKGDNEAMKEIPAFALVAAILTGCGVVGPNSTGAYDITANFFVTDTAGGAATNFVPGENIDMSFSMVNNSRDTLIYYGGPQPPVVFRILKNGAVIATSVDGYAFPQVVVGRALLPGDTLKGYWNAPTTPAQTKPVVLSPGTYKAEVLYPEFKDKTVSPVAPITFSVEK